jgi:hypothetical protein
VYTALGRVLSLKVPVPLVLHVPEVAEPPNDPAKVALLFEHIVWFGPAEIVATGFTVIDIVDAAGIQGPAPSGSLEVKVSITVPVVMDGV